MCHDSAGHCKLYTTITTKLPICSHASGTTRLVADLRNLGPLSLGLMCVVTMMGRHTSSVLAMSGSVTPGPRCDTSRFHLAGHWSRVCTVPPAEWIRKALPARPRPPEAAATPGAAPHSQRQETERPRNAQYGNSSTPGTAPRTLSKGQGCFKCGKTGVRDLLYVLMSPRCSQVSVPRP